MKVNKMSSIYNFGHLIVFFPNSLNHNVTQQYKLIKKYSRSSKLNRSEYGLSNTISCPRCYPQDSRMTQKPLNKPKSLSK